jgi:hypothetical protein
VSFAFANIWPPKMWPGLHWSEGGSTWSGIKKTAYPLTEPPIGMGAAVVHSYMQWSRWNSSSDALRKVTLTDVEVGLAAAGERARGRVHNCGVQACAGGVTGDWRCVDGRVDISQQARDRRPVVQIDHGRRGAVGLGDVRLGVVTDQRDHLVAVLVQFGQYVGSDESCRAGQCTFIAGASSLWVMEAGPVPGSPPGG